MITETSTTTEKRKRGRPKMTAEQRAARKPAPKKQYNRKAAFIARPEVIALTSVSLETQRLLSRPEVIARTGISTSAIYLRIGKGTFPQSIQISKGAVRWRSADIAAWIADPTGWRPKASNGNAAAKAA